MLYIHTKVKASPIHGLGCFTEEPIAKGALIWKFMSTFDQKLTKEEITSLPELAQIYLATYAYKSKKTGLYILAADNAKYFNHSTEPNSETKFETNEDEDVTYALRDIKAGEEMTIDYSSFENNYGTEENALEEIFKTYNLTDEVDPRLKPTS